MAHIIKFEPKLGCVFVRFSGLVALRELEMARAELEAMPGFRPGLDRLWDQRDCRIELSTEEVRWLADAWRAAEAVHGRRRVAYLVEDPVAWGLNRMFEALRDSTAASFGLFRSFPEARDWLGLPADFADPFEAATPAESEQEVRLGE